MDRRSFIEALPAAGFSEAWGVKESGAALPKSVSVCTVDAVSELVSLRPADSSCGPVAVARGYARPYDGGGGLFLWTEESSEAINRATVVGQSDVQGRWKRMHDGSLPIEALGAGTVGPRDASRALALAATLPKVQRVGCSETYHLDAPVLLKGPLTIEGGTFLVGKKCFQEGDRRSAFVVASSDVEFDGTTVRGPSVPVEGPVLVVNVESGAENFSLRDVRLHRFTSVHNQNGKSESNRISRIVAVRIHQTGCRSFEIAGCEVADLHAVGNGQVGDSDGVCTGILVGNTSGMFDPGNPTKGTIRNSRFRNLRPVEDADGVKTQLERDERGLRTLIENCTFRDCAKRGVKCQAPDTRVVGNTFRAESLVARNAVSIYRDGCTVSDNQIRGRFNFGVEIKGDDFVVDANRITCTAPSSDLQYRDSSGLWLRSGKKGMVHRNTVFGFLQGLTVRPNPEGVDEVQVCENRFEAPIGNAVVCRPPEEGGAAGAITLAGNSVVDPGKRALFVQANRNEGQYDIRVDRDTIKKRVSAEETDEEPAMYIQAVRRLVVQNVFMQVDDFTHVLTAIGCGRVLLVDCDIERTGSSPSEALIQVSGSDRVLIKGTVIPKDATLIEREAGREEGVRLMGNYTW